jgi:leader peptidase (prepilin peptidase)/N-methyltransferase
LLLSIIFLTDLEAFIIPDCASLGGAGLGLVFAALDTPGLPDLKQALLGGLCGFALIYGINALYRLWRHRDGMGFGDVKLMVMLGVWLGPTSLLPILFAASMAGAVFCIAMILAQQNRHETAPAQVPFGCFLVPAALGWLLFVPHALAA